MTNREIETAIERLVDGVPALLKEAGVRRDTCILTTRIVTHTFAELGVPAGALDCQVIASNALYREMLEQGDSDNVEKWQAAGAWSVMIGYGIDPTAERPGYDGHVLAVVKNRWVLDLTIQQASRESKGITLRPWYFEAPRDFIRGSQPLGFHTDERATVVYVPRADERSYIHAPDWRLTRCDSPLVKAALAIARGQRVKVTAA